MGVPESGRVPAGIYLLLWLVMGSSSLLLHLDLMEVEMGFAASVFTPLSDNFIVVWHSLRAGPEELNLVLFFSVLQKIAKLLRSDFSQVTKGRLLVVFEQRSVVFGNKVRCKQRVHLMERSKEKLCPGNEETQ